MPKEMEESLKKTSKKRGYGKKRTNAYVYGTIANMKKKKKKPSQMYKGK